MYASTRMLYNLALEGKAPRLFSRVSRSGVPRNALYATTLVGALCFPHFGLRRQHRLTWLLNTSGMCGFIAWLGIAISHYRFRKGYLAQGGRLEDLPYRAKLFPFGPLFAFAPVHGHHPRAELPGAGGRTHRLDRPPRHLYQPAAVPGDLAGILAGRSAHASFATTKWTSARPIPDSPCRPAIPRGSLRMPARFLLRSGSLAAPPRTKVSVPGLPKPPGGQNAPRPRGVVSRERRTGPRPARQHTWSADHGARDPACPDRPRGFDKTYDTHDLTRGGRWRVSW